MVAQDAVVIQHGVDMPLGGGLTEGGVGLLQAQDGEPFPAEEALAALLEGVRNLGGAGRHHIVIAAGSLCQPLVRLRVRLTRIEDVHSDSRRAAVLRLIQDLNGHGDNVPAPLLIGADLIHGPLVDAHQDNILLRGAAALVPGV